jgi:hypothetical protein
LEILEAQFRRQGGEWLYRLVPGGRDAGSRAWSIWKQPPPERLSRQLLSSLFESDEDRELLKRSWHLRLRPETFGSKSQGIPDTKWTYLVHPDSRCHILELGWTLTELVDHPVRGLTTERAVVIGNRDLTKALQRLAGPFVSDGAVDALPEKSLVIVGSEMTDAAAAELDERAWNKRCPLIVWCASQPPRGDVPCIFAVERPRELLITWLNRFLVRVIRGVDPLTAFADTVSRGPAEDRHARMMRGAYEDWKISERVPALALPQNWYVTLDRSKQEGHLKILVEGLLGRFAKRRIQVVFTPGPDGAGLDLFRHRPPHIQGPLKLIEWDLGWTDEPGQSIQVIARMMRTKGIADLALRLQEEAARHETGALFLVRHETVSFEVSDHARQVTIEALGNYLADLRKLAVELAPSTFRMLVHISVLGSDESQLEDLKLREAHFMSDVIKALDRGVPRDELEQWLSARDLPFSDDDLVNMERLAYDDLIQTIVNRYPELVGQ